MIVITNANGSLFSHVKEETPAMHKKFKELREKYKKMFGQEFFTKRVKFNKEGKIIK